MESLNGGTIKTLAIRPHWLTVLVYIFVLPIVFVGVFSSALQLISICGVILLVVLFPFLVKKGEYDVFSPWAIICYRVFLTVFVCSIYVTFDLPDPEYISVFYLSEKPKEFLVLSSFYVLGGILFLTIGYLFQTSKRSTVSLKVFKTDQWNSRRFNYFTIILLLLSWIGFYFYVTYAVEGSLIEKLSAYRRIMSTEIREYRSYGYLSWLVTLSTIVYHMSWVRIVSRSTGRCVLQYLIFVLSSVTSISFFFISGVRSGIVLWFIALLALTYYTRRNNLNASIKVVFIIAFMFVLFIFKFMSDLRPGTHDDSGSNTKLFNLFELTAPFIASGNGIDISKTGYIIEAIPEKLDFQWGGTFLNILYAWIPREVWPNKPLAPLDGIIAMKIYGAEAYGGGGIPPGLIAELYLNFWLIGVPFGCFLVGCLIKKIYAIFREYRENRNVIIMYVACFMELGFSLMGSGFVSTLIGVLSVGIPLFGVLNIVTCSSEEGRKTKLS
jgi:oligosaccharide repeat unit polymerase